MNKKRGHRFIDISGQKFGKLTVIEFSRFSGNTSVWKCVCECGNIKDAFKHLLKDGTTKSCGCIKEIHENARRDKNYRWNGVGELSGQHFYTIKKRALKKGIEFNIDKEYLWELFLKQNKKCYTSGLELSFSTTNISFDGTASLDRIDSNKGYIKGNVQWVHKTVNIMKNILSQKEFIDWCKIITDYQQGK